MDWIGLDWTGLDWILLRSLVLLEHLAVLKTEHRKHKSEIKKGKRVRSHSYKLLIQPSTSNGQQYWEEAPTFPRL